MTSRWHKYSSVREQHAERLGTLIFFEDQGMAGRWDSLLLYPLRKHTVAQPLRRNMEVPAHSEPEFA